MLYDVLATVPRLMEFVYAPAAHVSVKLTEEVARVPINPGPPTTNTRGATPQKDEAQVVDKGKSKKVDKGKGKMIEPNKPNKPSPISLQIGGAFKIYEPRALVPLEPPVTQLVKKSLILKKKLVETPPRVAEYSNW